VFPELHSLIVRKQKEPEHNHLMDAGLKHLRNLNKLEELHLCGHRGITDAGIEHLEKLSRLKQVKLNGTKVSNKGGERLKRALPKAQIYWD
jgi:hypothetical protein